MSVVDFAQPASLKDNIWLSLHVRRGSFFQRPGFGSRLHELERATATDRTAARAAAMAKDALAWLIDQELASTITALAAIESDKRLRLDISVTSTNRQTVDVSTFIPVGVIA